MGDRPKDDFSASSLHTGMLQDVVGSDAASEAWFYSYQRSFNGFAARLTEEEVEKMTGMEGVVSVFPSRTNQLHTTRSWDFMGFTQHVKRASIESNVVAGMLDTGIWPESESFSDEGFGPAPKKWKGICQTPSNFTCNNKVIGARFYHADGKVPPQDIESPRDSQGHGTHTASTAAGNEVTKASLLGLGLGTVRGGVPSSRIAVYKICWSTTGCSDVHLLAAFDDAIADGVDIISVSIGGSIPVDYFQDPIAIGAFHAMKKGILTSNSAGNSGPDPYTLSNFAPWTLIVAASTIDRKFVTKIQLGNGKVYEGVSVNTFDLKDKMYPMIYAGDAPNITGGFDGSQSRFCTTGSLDKALVTGKIVLCDFLTSGNPALSAGAVGTVMQDGGFKDVAFAFPLPASYLGLDDGSNVSLYLNTTKYLFFSPPLSPDITAPGVDILASWPPISSLTESENDTRSVSFNIISGTSMSCPHATGVAAYIKSFHPTWSPAAIKSALMTTANAMNVATNADAEFAYGAGHINPLKALNPGLVYDANEVDYVKFLCGSGYDTKSLRIVTGDLSTCTSNETVWDLNYPSFALTAKNTSFRQTFHRTVTNVGSPGSTYKARVLGPSNLKIKVVPRTMDSSNSMISASLVWSDGVYHVRSPIVVYPAASPGSN
ncbi:hypothetical protein C5167_005463 [Papaver somniferum]|uniref:Uncharacterized protein n=1 Tax=Papaver somniferum TaxID=3469 RepID=A0A4Y7JBI1_PAPSO|nr:hypothetical protein C5167_005463 [Papaver somniferum]